MSEVLRIHWMVHAYLNRVLEIEMSNYEIPWNEDDFVNRLRTKSIIGMVCLDQENPVAFVIYERQPFALEILNLCVDPSYQRRAIGWMLVSHIKSKLGRRKRIIAKIDEKNLKGQMFAKAIGFNVVGVQKYQDHGSESVYVFEHEPKRKVSWQQWSKANRINQIGTDKGCFNDL